MRFVSRCLTSDIRVHVPREREREREGDVTAECLYVHPTVNWDGTMGGLWGPQPFRREGLLPVGEF